MKLTKNTENPDNRDRMSEEMLSDDDQRSPSPAEANESLHNVKLQPAIDDEEEYIEVEKLAETVSTDPAKNETISGDSSDDEDAAISPSPQEVTNDSSSE